MDVDKKLQTYFQMAGDWKYKGLHSPEGVGEYRPPQRFHTFSNIDHTNAEKISSTFKNIYSWTTFFSSPSSASFEISTTDSKIIQKDWNVDWFRSVTRKKPSRMQENPVRETQLSLGCHFYELVGSDFNDQYVRLILSMSSTIWEGFQVDFW